ncbi:MAG: hypothetical protein JRG75_06810 [Deltaproteobacteria bacterium]|nr:hypothetical protein [Deltaproteobacteria bacterium]
MVFLTLLQGASGYNMNSNAFNFEKGSDFNGIHKPFDRRYTTIDEMKDKISKHFTTMGLA